MVIRLIKTIMIMIINEAIIMIIPIQMIMIMIRLLLITKHQWCSYLHRTYIIYISIYTHIFIYIYISVYLFLRGQQYRRDT